MLPTRAIHKSVRCIELRLDEYDKSELYAIFNPIRLKLISVNLSGIRSRSTYPKIDKG